jgi:6-phosphogluconolactonase
VTTPPTTPAATPPRIEVHDSAHALATAAAGELLARLADLQAAGREPHICLTGGSIADAVHREVARLSESAEIDWSRVVVWWGDERFVEPASDDRNERQARESLLDQVDVDPAKIHPMPSTETAASVDEAAVAYSDEVRLYGSGAFDVLMLGLGPDGHVASLFPGFPQLDVDDRVAVGVTDSPKPPPERVSLTLPTLNRATSVWFLASGPEKAAAVARALADDTDPHDCPASAVTGTEETIWFLDRDSASHL